MITTWLADDVIACVNAEGKTFGLRRKRIGDA